jgi:putative oxygen-independent coproporphyrinogen III oxidase
MSAISSEPVSALSLPPLSLYIHLPWCVRKCPYCDFNSHQRPQLLPEAAYVDALLGDLDHDLPAVYGRPLVSIFFGGGTPSLFSARSIGAILDGVRSRFRLRPGAEITLETNPGAAEYDRLEGYREAGVNRLSFGVQSFDDAMLKRLGRIHGGDEARAAVRAARAAGFDNLNLDLMYALPGQTPTMAAADLDAALELAPEHLSYYHLTLEPNTVFAARPPSGLPDEELAADIEAQGHETLARAGFDHYEVSAFARSGRRSVHNLNYWRYGDYLGIGAGAHGKWTDLAEGSIRRRVRQKVPRLYLDAPQAEARISEDRRVPPEDRPFEFMLNALRLQEGFPANDFAARTGLTLASLNGHRVALGRGLIDVGDGSVRPTELGRRFLNDLINLY